MRVISTRLRAVLSVVVGISLVTVFSLASMAYETAIVGLQDNPAAPQGLTGVLNVRGDVRLNGNAATSGTTVVSGNSIATGSNGNASIELATLGRVELKSNTAITIILTPNSVPITLTQCGKVIQSLPPGIAGLFTDPNRDRAHVKVITGQVHVKYDGGKEKDLKTGDKKWFDHLEEITTPGGTTYEVSCHEPPVAAFWLLGLAGLAGLAVGIDRTVDNGGPTTQPAVSPVQP